MSQVYNYPNETSYFQASRGDADFDVRHNASAAVTYNLPSPAGPGLLKHVLGGWSLDGIFHAQSASPLTVTVSSQSLFGTTVADVRPDLLPGVPVYLKDQAAPGGLRLNKAAFQAPPSGRQGSLGRNSLRGFPLSQFDLSFRRQFDLAEQRAIQLRADVFNLFNHPNFAAPETSLNNINFGLSTQMLGRSLGGLSPIYQIGGPRSIQLGLKLLF